jgi:hypothetical protein
MDEERIQLKIERCRRIASWMTDDEVRQSLNQLAEEYEAQLPRRRRDSFMLRSKSAGH